VKKEWTTTERKVQHQKRQAHRLAERARKAEALAAPLEEEKQERSGGHEDAGVARRG
jgi:hypothetical protein